MAESPVEKGRLAFVTQRYGPDVVGGSEQVMREAAHGLAGRGWDVEVLTTCARDHYTWENEYQAGTERTGGLVVRRFPTVHDGDRQTRDLVERRIQLGVPVTPPEQQSWVHGLYRVPDLYHHLVGAGDRYDAVIVSPYLSWLTVTVSGLDPKRTIVVPCLHDENYAYLDVFRPVLEQPAQLWFLSEPEHQLAHRLADLPNHRVTGAGVQLSDAGDGEGFRRRHGLAGVPFVLYAGRREAGKGWLDLLHSFTCAVRDHGVDLRLVTFGVGPVEPDPAVADYVVDLGRVDDQTKADVFAASDAYVQPSVNESFSLTVLESWLSGAPVIANAGSDVVAWHVERSGAGVVYEDLEELTQALVLLADAPEAFAGLAGPGADYVRAHYLWDVVLDSMEDALSELVGMR